LSCEQGGLSRPPRRQTLLLLTGRSSKKWWKNKKKKQKTREGKKMRGVRAEIVAALKAQGLVLEEEEEPEEEVESVTVAAGVHIRRVSRSQDMRPLCGHTV
jgi:hypothetical protein